MHALGALVITGDGIATDIDISVSVGGALSSVLALDVDARLVFNTTSGPQSITIPARYVDFLTGTAPLISLPPTATYDTAQLAGLTGALDDRFTLDEVVGSATYGSATFTIPGGAPRLDGGFDADGPYFLISLHGKLTVASTFEISADFQLKISDTGLELGFNGTIDLGGFITLDVAGGAVIENGVFAAYVELGVDVDLPGIDYIHIGGSAVLEINSGNAAKDIFDAQGNLLATIDPHTFLVTVAAEKSLSHPAGGIDLFGVLTAEGSVTIGVTNGDFLIAVDAKLNFFKIVDIEIDRILQGCGERQHQLQLYRDARPEPDDRRAAIGKFGIEGGLSVTLSNSGFSGHGDVKLVILGESVKLASATVSVNWDTGDWLVRAEGPLGIWLEVRSSNSAPFFSLDGGFGIFDAIFDAIGDAAIAVGEAFVDAANAVAAAFEDLGAAILDFGQDVLDFASGLITDLADLASDVIGAISSAFESSRTRVETVTPSAYSSYQPIRSTDWKNSDHKQCTRRSRGQSRRPPGVRHDRRCEHGHSLSDR